MGSKVIYFVYRVLGAALFPVVLIYFLVRVIGNRTYLGTLRQRLGFLPREFQQTGGGSVWFHAVSVGEAIAIVKLVRLVRHLLPGVPVFVSATTLAGFVTMREKLGPEINGAFFAPVDYVWAVRRVLRRIRPSVVVIAETEIWPNLFREAHRSGAALLMVNGRISDKAAPKYIRWRWFFRAVLHQATEILVQSEPMRKRFVDAGALPGIVAVGGNLKYDVEPVPVTEDSPVRHFLNGRKVWIAASTSEQDKFAEEDAIISSFRNLEGWCLILAPRKPERFGQVARKLEQAGVRFVCRTKLTANSEGDVLLLDTVGELAGLFSLADAVFMGGSLASCGGHNILEPAAFGKTITVGPHMENFREIAEQFRAAGAIREIQTAAELSPFVDSHMGDQARLCAACNRGATDFAAQRVKRLFTRFLPCPSRSLPARIWLTPLTQIWRWGGDRRRARALARQEKLDAPVISVGNITVGGTGKTPTVLHLATRLSEAGWHPGVLTRGYGRASPHELTVVGRGREASRAHTGDEAQTLLRSGLLALGVGSNRAEAGRQLIEQGLADVLLLDDGFQHVKLFRDFDLVLIDALSPFGGCELVPLGRLREPLTQLGRASAFLITRADANTPVDAIEAELHRLNPNAPVFRSRVVPKQWVELNEGEQFPPDALPFRRTLAFCGLGNPRSFWNTLHRLNISPVESLEYGDHHLYTPRETRRFGQLGRSLGVEALLTTEKDAMNLCELTAEAVLPLRVFSLRIAIEIEGETELLRLLSAKIRPH